MEGQRGLKGGALDWDSRDLGSKPFSAADLAQVISLLRASVSPPGTWGELIPGPTGRCAG